MSFNKEEKDMTGLTILIIAFLISLLLGYSLVLSTRAPPISEELAKCVGEKCILYVKIGCPHCYKQKQLFGDNLKYIQIIECSESPETCFNKNITNVPFFDCEGKIYKGYKDEEELKEMSGCYEH